MRRAICILSLLVLLLAGCGPAWADRLPEDTAGTPTAHMGWYGPGDVLTELLDSLSHEPATGMLSFTVPQTADDRLFLSVVGRIEGKENWKMTWPAFADAAVSGWEPGRSYTGAVQLAHCDYIEVVAAVIDQNGVVLAKQTAVLHQNGQLTVNPVEIVEPVSI